MTTIPKTAPANALPSEADMAEWRRLADAATDGLIVLEDDEHFACLCDVYVPDLDNFVVAQSMDRKDATFFIAARVAVPALLDATTHLAAYESALKEVSRQAALVQATEAERARLAERVVGLEVVLRWCRPRLANDKDRIIVDDNLNPERDTTEAGR